MRLVSVLAWAVVIVALLSPLLRRLGTPTRPRPALRDELVKDPVCQTYIARARAVRLLSAGEPVYFCSHECARRYMIAGT
jgi:YHS domain-containing protein